MIEVIEHSYRHSAPYVKRQKTTGILIHCSATPEGKDYTAEQINTWHLQRGFNGIGYHFVIYRDGSIHRGRPVDVKGAHCTGQNSVSVGVCYIGGCAQNGKTAKDTRTEAQKASMVALVKELMKKYKLTKEKVYPHYKFAKKACPSFKIEELRALL